MANGKSVAVAKIIIYVNNLLLEFEKRNIGSVEMYSDDTIIYTSDKNIHVSVDQTQKCLDVFSKEVLLQ